MKKGDGFLFYFFIKFKNQVVIIRGDKLYMVN